MWVFRLATDVFGILCSGSSDSGYFLHDFAEETAELKLQQKVFLSVCFHCQRTCQAARPLNQSGDAPLLPSLHAQT